MRGRKPDPTSERSLARVESNVRSGLVNSIPEPPERLSSDAQRVWDIMLPGMIEQGVYRPEDALLLVEYVELVAETAENRRECRDMADKSTAEYKRVRTAWHSGLVLVDKIGSSLGLGPVARIRLGLTQLKGATLLSHFEDID